MQDGGYSTCVLKSNINTSTLHTVQGKATSLLKPMTVLREYGDEPSGLIKARYLFIP